MGSAKTDDKKPEKKSSGCVAGLALVLLLVMVLGMGVGLFFMAQPQDLADIQGSRKATRDLLRHDFRRVLQGSIDRQYPISISERELNTWLADVVVAKQEGMLGGEGKVMLTGAWVRLLDGRAELVLERQIAGRPFTVSMFLQVAQTQDAAGIHTQVKLDGGPYHPYIPFPVVGGRFGKLGVPQGFLTLVMPSFKALAEACKDEISLGYDKMARIKIEKGRVIFDPRVPTRTVTSLDQP